MRGLFITFEGIEGCGKSTQVELLKANLEAKGCTVEVTREPGGTAISEEIRNILLDPAHGEMSPIAELLLYQASRAQHVSERIRPALESGTIVVCDRFYDSTTAYQGAGRGLPRQDLKRLHTLATGGLSPDLTILIDLDAETGLTRVKNVRESDRMEQESLAFHNRVREGFLKLADQETERIKVVDGGPPQEKIAAEILLLVTPLLDTSRT